MESKTLEIENPPEFASSVIKVAVAQICQSTGFNGSNSLALQTLTAVATKYLQALAKFAAATAAANGRTQSNIFDVIAAIEELGLQIGFAGASNVNQSFVNSTPLVDLIAFVDSTDEIPFAKPIPRDDSLKTSISLRRNDELIPCFAVNSRDYDIHNNSSKTSIQMQKNDEFNPNVALSSPNSHTLCKSSSKTSIFSRKYGEIGRELSVKLRNSHIPPWLPIFPDPSTYETKRRSNRVLWPQNCKKVEEENEDFARKNEVSAIKNVEKYELGLERKRVSFRIGRR